uniref:Uncharacterized protein n=1 Tax=mine drainage metagenome TaxID=410659 RepID=E6QJ86_9ZZZZ
MVDLDQQRIVNFGPSLFGPIIISQIMVAPNQNFASLQSGQHVFGFYARFHGKIP